MKSIPRDPLRFDTFELYSRHAKKLKAKITDATTLRSFLKEMKQSIKKQLTNGGFLHGQRAEVLFEMVVASLGTVKVLKKEDDGDLFHTLTDEVKLPDFRILLEDGRQILVEVKNFHQDTIEHPHCLRVKDTDALRAYSTAMGAELFIATYWSRMHLWTLVKESDYRTEGNNRLLNCGEAMTRNHMHLLGDKMIGTRAPIRFRTEYQPLKMQKLKKGRTKQTLMVKSMRMYSEDRMLKDKDDIRIASYLAFYGDWVTGEQTTETDANGGVTAVDIPVAPLSGNSLQEKQGFDLIGHLSGMLSRAFAAKTVKKGKIFALRADFEPGAAAKLIPGGYHEQPHDLPLWVITVQPEA